MEREREEEEEEPEYEEVCLHVKYTAVTSYHSATAHRTLAQEVNLSLARTTLSDSI